MGVPNLFRSRDHRDFCRRNRVLSAPRMTPKTERLIVEVSQPRHMLHTIRSGRSDTQSTAPLKSRWGQRSAALSRGLHGAFVVDPDGNDVDAVRTTTVASARSSRSRSTRIRTF